MVTWWFMLLLWICGNYNFELESADLLKHNAERWPKELWTADDDRLRQYAAQLEARVARALSAKHRQCEAWRPAWWCGGKTKSGGVRIPLAGCEPSPVLHTLCINASSAVESEVTMLQAVERRISSSNGLLSLSFLSRLYRCILGSIDSALGIEDDAFPLHLYHSDVAPLLHPQPNPFMTFVSFLNLPYFFLPTFAAELPWLVADYLPLRNGSLGGLEAAAGGGWQGAVFAPDGVAVEVVSVAICFAVWRVLALSVRRQLFVSGLLVFAAHPDWHGLAVLACCSLLILLGDNG
ncbi:hypothetical protein DIPPA_24981 [Diplonema papillatum]|nr:hypothetical protein DIPPA_24981 [Diplonema papillatum]